MDRMRIKTNFLQNILVAVVIIAGCVLVWGAVVRADTEQAQQSEKITRRQLKIAAANSLWRLKRAIERDGYYGARVTLNVWRSNAIEAGTFKQEQYDEYKKQIYEKSIQNSLQCFEYGLENESYTDAKRCLYTYKIRSEEIGAFDQSRYEEMNERLKSLQK
jgi:hypothetical protein